jgi:hypothetical protein
MGICNAEKIIRRIIRRAGFDIVRYRPNGKPGHLGYLMDEEIEIVQFVRPYTLMGDERVASLIDAVRYVAAKKSQATLPNVGYGEGEA